MTKFPRALAGLAVLTALATPALAGAREDEDVLSGDPASKVVVFAADGAVTESDDLVGARTFHKRLAQQGALGGSQTDVVVHRGVESGSRIGVSKPSGERYRRLAPATRKQAQSRMSVELSTLPDGREIEERGYAVDTRTGVTRRISLEAARRLSADPRGGTPNTEYVFTWVSAPDLYPAG